MQLVQHRSQLLGPACDPVTFAVCQFLDLRREDGLGRCFIYAPLRDQPRPRIVRVDGGVDEVEEFASSVGRIGSCFCSARSSCSWSGPSSVTALKHRVSGKSPPDGHQP